MKESKEEIRVKGRRLSKRGMSGVRGKREGEREGKRWKRGEERKKVIPVVARKSILQVCRDSADTS